jgi:transposase InsO family protein
VSERRITAQDVIDQPSSLSVLRGIPQHIRSDNGVEFTARGQEMVKSFRDKDAFHRARQPLGQRGTESSNSKLGGELLNREVFAALTEAKVLIADWRKECNQVRPHSPLSFKPSTPEAKMLAALPL